MFGKSKSSNFNYIIAVKDYENTLKAIQDGTIFVQVPKDTYSKLFDSQVAKVDNIKELKKFMKITNKTKSEVGHYWDTLLTDGYTLLAVKYEDKNPTIDKICELNLIKLAGVV